MNRTLLDIVVLTGFLGSGKTTLLTAFLTDPQTTDIAVIVNEIGEIGLDGAILRESAGDVQMAMLSNGCVCCQMGSDLATTIDALMDTERPIGNGPLRRIVLETSGVSKPGPILRQLASLDRFDLRVSVLTTYDTRRGSVTSDFAEAAAQWAAAHRVIATKLDLVSATDIAAARKHIAAINPLAEIIVDLDRSTAVRAAFAPLLRAQAFVEPPSSMDESHPRIAVRVARPATPPSYDVLATWLDNLAGALGERLLRLKGIVHVAEVDRPLLVQSVGTVFSPPRPFGSAQMQSNSFLVIIVRDLDTRELEHIHPVGTFIITR